MPAVLMLRDIEATEAANRIHSAVERVLTAGKLRPHDLGGSAGTAEFTEEIVAEMK